MFGNTRYTVRETKQYRYLHIPAKNQSAPNLVFLHGMFGGLSNFDALIRRLESINVYVPVIPLYEMKRRELSIPVLSDWVGNFITEFDIDKPILLGNSLGGHLALQYAHQYSESPSALVLTGSSGLLENNFGNTSPRRKDPEYIRRQANLTFYEDLADDRLVEEIMEVTESPIKLLKLLSIARSTQKHNMEEKLAEIELPVLLIWGKNDIITPPEVAQLFFNKLPNAELKWIDRCGHAPMMERPDEFAGYLKSFLNCLSIFNFKSKEKEIHTL